MATPEVIYCDMEDCKFNCDGECEAEELRINDMRECETYEKRKRR
jgi:hypothetical protein